MASKHDLQIAIAWLECNEGEDGESLSCKRVADFLTKELNNRLVTGIARRHRITKAIARKVLERTTEKAP